MNASKMTMIGRVGKLFALIVGATAFSPIALIAQEVGFVKVAPELRAPLEIRNVKGAPYSAQIVIESTHVLADGNRIVQRSTSRVYRDSEGRVRREEDRPNGSASVSIVDPVAGVAYSLDLANHVAWKTPMPVTLALMTKLKKLAPGHRQELAVVEAHHSTETVPGKIVGYSFFESVRGQEQHKDEQLPEQLIEGVRATGHRGTTTIPAGAIGNELPITIVSEEWTSPELQVLVMTHRTDPRTGESSYRLQNIVRSEPDAYLFQVPDDFSVKEGGIQKMEFER